ncbi:4-hydroxyphenylpyruvate dioxygenase [Candidatus Kaiserbacteria bacterium]|nr:4-hydroxyphenylpyruvate dioxygenase [Candidatus Kaiserbacteria bacterium]
MEAPKVTFRGIDHIDVRQVSSQKLVRRLSEIWGFEEFAYAGRQTGRKDVAARVLRQGNIVINLSEPMHIKSPLIASLDAYGEGVSDVAFGVSDVRAAYNYAIEHSGIPVARPKDFFEKVGGEQRVAMTYAAIGTCGPVVHTLIDRSRYTGVFAPGYVEVETPIPHASPVGLTDWDHFVLNVEEGQMNHWAGYYKRALRFKRLMSFSEEQISTDTAALRSVVMRSEDGTITAPINEPVEDKHSHIDDFLEDRHGPGVQHAALTSNDIVATVSTLRSRGEKFLAVPDTYYEAVPRRLKEAGLQEEIPQSLIDELRKNSILIDGDKHGYLLQIFTETLIGSGTGFFFEIIERRGCDGFGEGNFKALFESIERAAGRLK